MKANIRNVDNVPMPLRIDRQNSLSIVSFSAIREGSFDLTITFANHALPGMPIHVLANPVSSKQLKVVVYGRGSTEARVNEEAEFTIDTSQTSIYSASKPIVRLIGTQNDVEVHICQIKTNKNLFFCTYKPVIPGKMQSSSSANERLCPWISHL